jgi:hypothetical protein
MGLSSRGFVMRAKAGWHVGTEMGGRWWRRYADRAFSIRGFGHLWSDKRGLYFHRWLTGEPPSLSDSQLESIASGAFHAGRWAWGLPIFKVRWRGNGEGRSSGCLLSGDRAARLETLDLLRSEHAACPAVTN